MPNSATRMLARTAGRTPSDDCQRQVRAVKPFHVHRLPSTPEAEIAIAEATYVNLDEIVPFEDGPRLGRNPKWSEIKAAIRASGGLTTALPVTMCPGVDGYVCHQGGNTRLEVLKELAAETGDPKFNKVRVDILPYRGDFELAVLHDRENTCRGNLRYIEEAWSKYRLMQLYASARGGKITVRSFIRDMARDHGLSLTEQDFSRMRYTVEVLYQHIPTCLRQGGLSLRGVRQVVRARTLLKKVWDDRQLGTVAAFNESFYGLLARQDQSLADTFLCAANRPSPNPDSRIAIDWTLFLQDIQHEFSVEGGVDYQTAGAWIAAARRALLGSGQEQSGLATSDQDEGGAPTTASSRKGAPARCLRKAAFQQAREMGDVAGLGHLVEPTETACGYRVTGPAAASSPPDVKACWWALVLFSSSPEDDVRSDLSKVGAISFEDLSPAALAALAKLLATKAQITKENTSHVPR